jgi:hypothetical protein
MIDKFVGGPHSRNNLRNPRGDICWAITFDMHVAQM